MASRKNLMRRCRKLENHNKALTAAKELSDQLFEKLKDTITHELFFGEIVSIQAIVTSAMASVGNERRPCQRFIELDLKEDRQ